MSSETAILSSFVARLHDEKLNLAAFGISYSLLVLCEAPILPLMSASITLCRDTRSFSRFHLFALSLGLMTSCAVLVLSFPGVSEIVVLNLLGLDRSILPLVQQSLLILAPCPFAVGYRRFFQGILVSEGKARVITLGTILRLCVMSGTTWILYGGNLPGALVGAWGLVAGIVVEALFVRLIARKTVRSMISQQSDSSELKVRSILSFYSPLVLTSIVNLCIPPAITFALAYGKHPLESLAVMPVVNALMHIFRSIGFSYHEVVIATIGRPEAQQAIRFVTSLLALLSWISISVIGFTNVREIWFMHVSGLSLALSELAYVPTAIMTLLPPLAVGYAWARGVLVQQRCTFPITVAALLETGVILFVLIMGISLSELSAITIAALAMTIGECVSLIYLGRKLIPHRV